MRFILYLQDGNLLGELDVSPPVTYPPAHELVECAPSDVIAEIQAYEDPGQIERRFTEMMVHFFFSTDKPSEEFIHGFINFTQRIADAAYKKALINEAPPQDP